MITVVLVDDDPIVRAALTLVLGGQPDITVLGEAGDGRAAVDLVRERRPDVVLMDVRMPVVDGLSATRALHAEPFPPRVIVLTTFEADRYATDAVVAGADGYLLKDTPPEQIVAAVRSVAAGDPILSPSATGVLLEQVRARSSPDARSARARLATLTPREHDVAVAVSEGLSNAEVARRLHLSITTVKAHVSRLFDKLQATNRVQIALCVRDAGPP